MKNIKVSFDTWIQLLGMIGVLGGLIFVGLEMRQSQQIPIGFGILRSDYNFTPGIPCVVVNINSTQANT